MVYLKNMNRTIRFSVGEFYHLYNRGNDRRVIFRNNDDHTRFIHLLFLCNDNQSLVYKTVPPHGIFLFKRKQSLVDIGAYCLMPNHFHLLVRERIPNGITMFMKKLSTAYSMYFNLKNNRTGKLFEGAFRAEHVDDDQYLRYLYAYIHLNPVKLVELYWKENGIKNIKRASNFLKKFQYSSFLDYTGRKREEGAILDRTYFPDYFLERHSFDNFINDWLELATLRYPR